MSTNMPQPSGLAGRGQLPQGFTLEYPQPVATYTTYAEAQKAVDSLADQGFPVENLAIVGTDLRQYERVMGRRTWGSVLTQGALSGLSWGIMMAIFMLLLVPGVSLLMALFYGLILGAILGLITAALSYAFSRGQRDFDSITQTVALKYEVLAEHKVAAEARQKLGLIPDYSQPQPPVQQPPSQAQQPYGQQPPYAG